MRAILNILQVWLANISLFGGLARAYLEHFPSLCACSKELPMSSLWKDLLFLHGHLVRKEDLLWADQASPESTTATPAAATHVEKAGAAAWNGARPVKNCAAHWPRLAAPR
jgi:hypothetical protein